MDYALVHAVHHRMGQDQQVVNFYDINCQYSRNLQRRIEGNQFISLPPTLSEMTLGENTKDPTTHRDSEGIGLKRLGQRPKMSSNGEPLGAGLHCIYTTLHEGYARLFTRLCTVQCYASDVMVGLRLCEMTSREAACTA